jgi:hypothetical protein
MRYFSMILVGIAMGAAFLSLVGWTTMLLWNWLMPTIFNLCFINFWQALGLLVLSRILFGGFGGGAWENKKQHWKNRMKHKWSSMNEEERAHWQSKFERFCGKKDDNFV